MYKILVFFLLLSGFGYSQAYKNSSETPYPDTSRWVYFKLADTVSGEIIIHNKALSACGGRAFSSLSIIKTESDTIRVLDLCNENDYVKGQKVKIAPTEKPVFQVTLPLVYIIEGQKVTIFYNEYDKTILKTTWGQIIVK